MVIGKKFSYHHSLFVRCFQIDFYFLHRYTTYAPKPIYLTNYNRSLLIEQSNIAYFNLTADDRVEIELCDGMYLSGYVMMGSSWLDLLEEITLHTGRQTHRLPAWSQVGAVVGLEGGENNVTAIVDKMREAGVPLAGIWLQDWVGLRHNWDGDRLIWNWEVNYDWYPGNYCGLNHSTSKHSRVFLLSC